MSLLRNIKFNLLAFFLGKAAAACVGLLLPRLLGPEKNGAYMAAWGLATIATVVSDLGLSSFLIRAASREPERAGQWLWRGLLIQSIQVAAGAALLAGALTLSGHRGADAGLAALAFITMGLASLGSPFNAILQGQERYKAVAVLTSVASLMNAAALGLVLLIRPEPALALGALAVSGSLGLTLWSYAALKLGLLESLPPTWEPLRFFKESLPFAMQSAANQLYVRVDLALLSYLVLPAALGQYGAGVKLVDLAVPLLGAATGPLYPRLSAVLAQGPEKAAEQLGRGLRWMGALCLPLALGGASLATPFMRLVFGEAYAESGPAFAWLVLVPALIGMHSLLLFAMNAAGLTARIAWIFLGNLALNVALNLLLIPRFGIVAAAFASALCEAVVLVAALALLRAHGWKVSLRSFLWPSLPSALLMAGGLRLLGPSDPWEVPLRVALGAVLYGGALWAMGFWGEDERAQLKRMLGKA